MDPQAAIFANQVATNFFTPGTLVLIRILIIWSILWKGIALWKAGSKKQLARFVCLFIFNTVGILPIIYLAFFQKKEENKKEIITTKKTKK